MKVYANVKIAYRPISWEKYAFKFHFNTSQFKNKWEKTF